jgi:propionyl-CoA synthetase
MVPEALIAMLACARLGAIHSVVFGGFAGRELAVRIDDAAPKVLLTASCGLEADRVIPYGPLVEEALALAARPPKHCVVLERPEAAMALQPGRDHSWTAFEADAAPVDAIPLAATDPLYILYTSGTTGKPKGVVRDHGGHAVALAASMARVYDTGPGDVFWAASDVGWVVGHSYICYAPLLVGATTVLYEGKPVRTPDASAFWRVMAEYGVKTFFTAPTAFRAMRKEDPEAALRQGYDLSRLKRLMLAGERCDPPTLEWLQDRLAIPVIDHWWQTETGSPICALPAEAGWVPKIGASGVPMPGYELAVLNEAGEPQGPGISGQLALALPLPPGTLPTVWGDPARFSEAYLARFPGYYDTGDGGYIDEDGYVFVMGRTDDVINVAGHRLSTGEIEEAVAGHDAVAECAVVGASDPDRGEVPVGFVVIKDGVNQPPESLEPALLSHVRQALGAFVYFRRAVLVPRLPKTRSGKILRSVLRDLLEGRPPVVPSTIDDVRIVEEIAEALAKTAGSDA